MSNWARISGVGAGVSAAAAVGQLIVSAVSLAQQNSGNAEMVNSQLLMGSIMAIPFTNSNVFYQQQEIAELQRRLEGLLEILKQRGYYDNANVRRQEYQARSVKELSSRERELERQIKALY